MIMTDLHKIQHLEQENQGLQQEIQRLKKYLAEKTCIIADFDQASVSTSKDQKKQVTWASVLDSLMGLNDKPGVAQALIKYYNPLSFLLT